MAYKHLITEVDDVIALIKISKPESLNAPDSEVITKLNDYFRRLDSDREVKVVIITGEGKSFITGADIVEMSSLNATGGNSFAKKNTDTFSLIERLSRPVITTINGFALGRGCELSLAYDIRTASRKTLIGQPEVGLGITPGFGGTQRFVRTIGPGKAKKSIFRANSIRADGALETGLVNKVVEPEELMDEAMKVTKEIASKSRLTVRYVKQAINSGLQADIDTRMDIERANSALCSTTEDQEEGMKVFLKKREPNFRGC